MVTGVLPLTRLLNSSASLAEMPSPGRGRLVGTRVGRVRDGIDGVAGVGQTNPARARLDIHGVPKPTRLPFFQAKISATLVLIRGGCFAGSFISWT